MRLSPFCKTSVSKNGGRLDETLKNAAPCLALVTINGVDVKNKKYILRLDEGDYDQVAWIKKLQAAGYKGPVGLQCYGVKGDTTENLKADIVAWHKIAGQLQ